MCDVTLFLPSFSRPSAIPSATAQIRTTQVFTDDNF